MPACDVSNGCDVVIDVYLTACCDDEVEDCTGPSVEKNVIISSVVARVAFISVRIDPFAVIVVVGADELD